MSYTLLDDELPESAKWAALSDAAFRFGIRALCWARKKRQMRLRPGFIPESMAAHLAMRSLATAKKLARELVVVGGGMHENGILVPVDGGWMIHDFKQYGEAKSSEPVPADPVKSPARIEAARVAGVASAESRRAKLGTAQPNRSNDSNVAPNVASNDFPNDSPNVAERSPRTSPNAGRSSSQDLSQDPRSPSTENTKELASSLKTSHVIASAGGNTGGLTELGAANRKQGSRPRFAALLAPTRLTAREFAIPDSVRAYAFELGLDTNATDDVIVDWRSKVADSQSADRLVSMLFRFIEQKANGPRAEGPTVSPAERAERQRKSQEAQREHEAWKAEQERKATEKATASLRARGIDPDGLSGLDLRKLIGASVG